MEKHYEGCCLRRVDLLVEGPTVEDKTVTDFAQRLRQNLQEAHGRARECLRQSARNQKRNYDRRVHGEGLKEGQFAYLFNKAKKKGSSPKLELRWVGPYLVVKRLSDVTYRIQLKPRSKAFVVHADRLKPYTGEALKTWEYRPEVVEEQPEAPEESSEPADVDHRVTEAGEPGFEVAEEQLSVEPPEAQSAVPNSKEHEEVVEVSPRRAQRRYPQRERRLPARYR